MLKNSKLRDFIILPTKSLNKKVGTESFSILKTSELNTLVQELDKTYTGLEDASQVLEEMKKVIIQHEANVQAEKAEEEQEGVGETEDGKLVADTNPESEGETSTEGDTDVPVEGSEEDIPTGDTPTESENEGEGEAEGEEDQPEETDTDSETNPEGDEGTAEATEEEVEQASEEKVSTEESAKDMNMAGEMLSGALFGARYKDLKEVLGIKSIGLNNIATSPLYVQQESLDNLKEVKDNISSYFKDKVKELTSKSKECLTKAKEELEDVVNKATALQKSIEVKEVTDGNFNTNLELKPYYKILLQNGITKENIKSYIERTKPIISTFILDNNRLDRIFQLASNLSSKNVSNELREKLFWEFVRPLQELVGNITLDPISQFTNSKDEGGQSELIHVSNQDASSNGLSLQIKPVKYNDEKGVYNSLTDYNIFSTSTHTYPDLSLDDNISLIKVKELANDICSAIQESKDMVNETIENNLNSLKALEEYDNSKFNVSNDLVDDILSGLSVIVYDHSAFTLAMLSKVRKSLDAAAIYTSNLSKETTYTAE